MYALTVTSKKQLERATSRAQAQKPRIEEVEFGIYNVWSTDPNKAGTFYLVGIQPAKDGGYEVACGCPTQNYFCKHVAAVMPHYMMRVKELEVAAQLLPVEEARAQAEQALASLVVNGVITTSEQEIERLIEEAKEKSLDRECPTCGLVQPDDDSTDCWACGAILDPEDEDPDPAPAVCECGKPGFSFFNNRWYCISCIKDMAAKEEVTCKDCDAPATGRENRCDACQMAKDSADLFGTPYPASKPVLAPVLTFVRSARFKEAW